MALRLGASAERGLVPPFRAGARDRQRVFLASTWAPALATSENAPITQIILDARVEALQDSWPDGERRAGFGDLELGALVSRDLGAPAKEHPVAARILAGWRAKLPDARDEGELGTDETDLSLLLGSAAELGPADLRLMAGLAIVGDPLRHAAQDDIPFVDLRVRSTQGLTGLHFQPRAGLSWAFETSRNPARGQAQVGLSIGRTWTFGTECHLGLSPAAPDVGGSAWLGYSR